MDQHGEKEGENKSQDLTAVAVAAAAEEGDSEESMDQGKGYKAEESAGLLLIKEVSSEEAASPPSPAPALFAHPCSLLQLLLRACAGCLGLHGYCSGADPKPAVVAPPPEAAVAAAADSSHDTEGGEKANDFYMQGEVLTRVLVVRRPRPPSERPREGGGANGGQHH